MKEKKPEVPPVAAPAPAEQVGRLEEELRQTKDQYLRALAEFDNTRKRLTREKEEFAKYAAEMMVRGLLPIVDSLDQALVAAEKRAEAADLVKGVQLIHRQLLALLQTEGVERMRVVGEPFDPHRHEAVAHADAGEGAKEGKVLEELHVGYTMHGKVLRPAMVKVGKAAPQQDSAPAIDPQTE
jgi:molecular chaperone GrpE